MATTEAAVASARARWRQARPVLVIGVLVVAVAVLLAVFAARPRAGSLDPSATTPDGSRALAQLLKAQGVTIVSVETAADAEAQLAGSPATLLITVPDRVPATRLSTLADRASAVVLIQPDNAVETIAPGLRVAGRASVEVREPRCGLPAAAAAGSAHAGGLTYETAAAQAAATGCYSVGGRPTLVRLDSGRRAITVMGSGVPFRNDRLDEQGNAALTMQLLGEHPRLVWYRPAVSDAELSGDSSLLDLLPDGWRWAAIQLFIAVVLLALWRARRLGPIVTEPLPVVVRAAEAVEGRGRLYRRVQARDAAAAALREAARARLRGPLGLGRDAPPQAIVQAAVNRTGRTEPDLTALLYGAPPQDDRALVGLAAELDALEREVRRQ